MHRRRSSKIKVTSSSRQVPSIAISSNGGPPNISLQATPPPQGASFSSSYRKKNMSAADLEAELLAEVAAAESLEQKEEKKIENDGAIHFQEQYMLKNCMESLRVGRKTERIVGRDEEKKKINDFIDKADEHIVSKNRGKSMYVSGVPGIGKTLVVKKVLEERGLGDRFSYVNCMTCLDSPTPTNVLNFILNTVPNDQLIKLKGKSTQENKLSTLQQMVASLTEPFYLLLDEVDFFSKKKTKKPDMLFNSIFDLPLSGPIVIIGIANSLALLQKQQALSFGTRLNHVDSLNFKPYKADQMKEIIVSRLDEVGGNKFSEQVFGPATLEFLTGKVSSLNGDCRKALELSSVALNELQIAKQTEVNMLTNLLTNEIGSSTLNDPAKETQKGDKLKTILEEEGGLEPDEKRLSMTGRRLSLTGRRLSTASPLVPGASPLTGTGRRLSTTPLISDSAVKGSSASAVRDIAASSSKVAAAASSSKDTAAGSSSSSSSSSNFEMSKASTSGFSFGKVTMSSAVEVVENRLSPMDHLDNLIVGLPYMQQIVLLCFCITVKGINDQGIKIAEIRDDLHAYPPPSASKILKSETRRSKQANAVTTPLVSKSNCNTPLVAKTQLISSTTPLEEVASKKRTTSELDDFLEELERPKKILKASPSFLEGQKHSDKLNGGPSDNGVSSVTSSVNGIFADRTKRQLNFQTPIRSKTSLIQSAVEEEHDEVPDYLNDNKYMNKEVIAEIDDKKRDLQVQKLKVLQSHRGTVRREIAVQRALTASNVLDILRGVVRNTKAENIDIGVPDYLLTLQKVDHFLQMLDETPLVKKVTVTAKAGNISIGMVGTTTSGQRGRRRSSNSTAMMGRTPIGSPGRGSEGGGIRRELDQRNTPQDVATKIILQNVKLKKLFTEPKLGIQCVGIEDQFIEEKINQLAIV